MSGQVGCGYVGMVSVDRTPPSISCQRVDSRSWPDDGQHQPQPAVVACVSLGTMVTLDKMHVANRSSQCGVKRLLRPVRSVVGGQEEIGQSAVLVCRVSRCLTEAATARCKAVL